MMRTLLSVLLGLALSPPLLAQCNSEPEAFDDQVEYFGRPISVEPMWNDREPDGEALELSVVGQNCSSPPLGAPISVVVDNGTLRLIPTQEGYATVCTVTYEIEDERGATDTAQVQIRETSLFSDGFETGNTSRWQ
jgi:hypothetical protein